MLKPYEREKMKMAMLKHEETFKQQVCELHRLYRIQKILMKGVEHDKPRRPNLQRINCISEIRLNQMNSNLSNTKQRPQLGFNLYQPAEEYIRELKGDKELEIEDESEIQLTLAPVSYNTRKKSETSDSGPSFSSSSTGSSNIIKGANQGPDQNQESLVWGLTMVTNDSISGYHSTKKNGNHRVQDKSSQGRRNQPPWLLQTLSLNMP